MTRLLTTLVAGFIVFHANLVPVIAADPQPNAGSDIATQIKEAQMDRIREGGPRHWF